MNKQNKLTKLFSPTIIAILIGTIIIGGVLVELYSSTSTDLNSNLSNTATEDSNSVETIPINQFRQKVKSGRYTIIDIRTPEEFNEGHIEGAINIDYYKSSFKDKIAQLDKDKKYLFYCRTGTRTSSALNLFKQLNFNEAYELQGGIKNWLRNGYNLN